MRKIVVVLYGPPGAGKGTQANLLASKLDLIHFDTGRFLESIVHDPDRQHEKVVRRERALFDGGKLMTPSFVTGEVMREARRIAKAGWGMVLSGSPRTMYEAKKLYPLFEKLYGKKKVNVFVLEVPPSESIRRNGARMVCKSCGYLLLTRFYPHRKPEHCPVCAGSFYKRSLDKPSVIKVRLKEYEERTFPIIDYVKKHGYNLHRVDARPAPYQVMEHIYGHVKDRA
ncbi:MAG TPA: nucleoside monophosphate kinase [Candidatus Paceibacterota bacterium]|nr:nucleoside monophosphate kinase [Candidatus Paceibacterota bacterium]